MILLLLACAEPPSPPPAPPARAPGAPTSPLDRCAAHVASPEVFGYCLTREVRSVTDVTAMAELCVRAGAWEGPCRHSWVVQQRRDRRGTDPAVLLAACGGDPDCSFEVLDAAPRGDVFAQIDACEAHVHQYASDCTVHALQRWVEGTPTVAEAGELRARFVHHPQAIGRFLAMAGCADVGIACGDGPDPVSAACRTAEARQAARPGLCRSR
ncbi:MAG: hypothetical protein V4850_19305 [Myxococcota bacterium]